MIEPTRFGITVLSSVLTLATVSSCGHRPPDYDVPPELLNRQQIAELLGEAGEGWEAEIRLLLRVDETGQVEDVRVVKGSGDRHIDAWAGWVAKQMRFKPAQYQGYAVPSLVEIPVSYVLPPPLVVPPTLQNADSVAGLMASQYPELRGAARLSIRVDPKGSVLQVRARDASSVDVGEAARALASGFRFSPATKDGQPVAAWAVLLVEFAGADSRVSIEPPEQPNCQNGCPRQSEYGTRR